MPEITPQRTTLYTEEFEQGRPTSQSSFNRFGAGVNFINQRQYDTHGFLLNGNYGSGVGTLGLDGVFVALYDLEIIGVSFYNISGTLGPTPTVFDLRKIDAAGAFIGTIFDVNAPQIDPGLLSSIGVVQYNSDGTVAASNFSGSIAALNYQLDSTRNTLDFGESIVFTLNGALEGARDCGIYIHFRPR